MPPGRRGTALLLLPAVLVTGLWLTWPTSTALSPEAVAWLDPGPPLPPFSPVSAPVWPGIPDSVLRRGCTGAPMDACLAWGRLQRLAVAADQARFAPALARLQGWLHHPPAPFTGDGGSVEETDWTSLAQLHRLWLMGLETDRRGGMPPAARLGEDAHALRQRLAGPVSLGGRLALAEMLADDLLLAGRWLGEPLAGPVARALPAGLSRPLDRRDISLELPLRLAFRRQARQLDCPVTAPFPVSLLPWQPIAALNLLRADYQSQILWSERPAAVLTTAAGQAPAPPAWWPPDKLRVVLWVREHRANGQAAVHRLHDLEALRRLVAVAQAWWTDRPGDANPWLARLPEGLRDPWSGAVPRRSADGQRLYFPGPGGGFAHWRAIPWPGGSGNGNPGAGAGPVQ